MLTVCADTIEEAREQWEVADPELFADLEQLHLIEAILYANHAGASIVLVYRRANEEQDLHLMHYELFARAKTAIATGMGYNEATESDEDYADIVCKVFANEDLLNELTPPTTTRQ